MKTRTRRALSLLLAVLLVLTLLPAAASAAEELPDASITVPADAQLFVGSKVKHYVPFEEVAAVETAANDDGTKTCFFELTDKSVYNYRVSGENYITRAGTFKKTADFSLIITKEQLQPQGKEKSTIDRSTASNSGYNVADIYLNINPQGFLQLGAGDTYQLVCLRNWEAVDTTTNNYFIEPDYHYAVVDENGNPSEGVVTVSDGGLVTARGSGTAIVLVTYDAINVTSAAGGPFFGAIWPENTGVFVVSVGADSSGIQTGMTINAGKNSTDSKLSGDGLDAEHDVIYFTGSTGSYTFTPLTQGCTVSAANPAVGAAMSFNGFEAVAAADDGSFTVPLTQGRNIVRIEHEGKTCYQVITAKRVSYTVNGGVPVVAGDTLSIVFDTLYHPANKLAGVYNMNAAAIYGSADGYDGKTVGTPSNQYKLASTAAAQTISVLTEKNVWGNKIYAVDKKTPLKVPEDHGASVFSLRGGSIFAGGFGDPYGNHRGITLEDGKAPNLNANVRTAFLGKLPDIVIPVTSLSGISIETRPSALIYGIGESFDPVGMVVRASYADGQSAEITDYSYSDESFDSAGGKTVTLSYTRGAVTKTAELDVTVVDEAELERIAVTAQPAKTSYQVNESFDPAGMVVTAYYKNGGSRAVSRYTLSHGKLISTDTAVTVSYGGKTASVPISVTGRVLSEIAVASAPSKTAYTVGEVFDPTGIKITARYDDTTTKEITPQVSFSGTCFTAAGSKSVTVSYTENGVKKTAQQSVTVAPSKQSEQPKEISVTFTLLGDSLHDESRTHTLAAGNLTPWISRTTITVPAGAKVIDAIARALGMAGIPYENPTGNYISSIRGLAEFSNGSLSGWMYTLNGRHPLLGVAEQPLNDGDAVVFHYTDDYTKEQGSETWAPAEKQEPAADGTARLEPAAQETAAGGAAVSVTNQQLSDAISAAKKEGRTAITIAPTGAENSGSLSVSIPKEAAQSVAAEKSLDLAVETALASVTLPSKTLASIAEQGGENVTVSVSRKTAEDVKNSGVDAASAVIVEVTVSSGERRITGFGGSALRIAIPVSGSFTEGETRRVIQLSADGSKEELAGKCEKINGKLFVTVTTTHLSTFVVTAQKLLPFNDIEGHWAEKAIISAGEKGIMLGSGESFDPDGALSRAMLVTILYRMEKEPAVTGKCAFSDVPEGQWYADAVLWAAENGVSGGVGEGMFSPDAAVTRQQLAAMLYRYTQYKKQDTDKAEKLEGFADAGEVAGWAQSAMEWAVAEKLISGRTADTLAPTGSASRAEVATILLRKGY